ncbi:hypothetical protein phiK7A1_035c [Pseudomonas phage phiK7A1]|uniref:Uncharacterized protein n=1 Tax=Pseudomonas phage phiK7A1 TaxID=2759194 RepID=A0A7H0XFN5_9CAUD|nr:hypothetical protein phiK7A1_035c [Pseudomonas phage phiK7A1]
MSIKMRLDTDALRALIKDNPEVEVEIGQAVLNNITTDTIKGKVEAQINACLKSMVKQSSGWPVRYEAVDKTLVQVINGIVIDTIRTQTEVNIKNAVDDAVSQAVAAERKKFGTEIRALLKELITPEMAREIVREKIL